MNNLNPAYVRWQKGVLDLLRVGGVWLVPSRLAIVRKVDPTSVELISAGSADSGEIDLIRRHIEAAGYSFAFNIGGKQPM